jgi:hypothetical protein
MLPIIITGMPVTMPMLMKLPVSDIVAGDDADGPAAGQGAQ